jgi:hypothetical protein
MGLIAWGAKLLGAGGAKAAGAALKDVLDSVDGLATSAEERGTLRKGLIETWVASQAAVIQAEYQHGNALSRSWRPILMLMWGGCITWTFVGPVFGQPSPEVPERLWDLLELGILGYIGGRSLEKMTSLLVPGKQVRKALAAMKE